MLTACANGAERRDDAIYSHIANVVNNLAVSGVYVNGPD